MSNFAFELTKLSVIIKMKIKAKIRVQSNQNKGAKKEKNIFGDDSYFLA
jgi:hypothetical protein